MAKNNLKSVRLSDDVLSIVESYEGNGFNQKFENLVIDFKKTLPEREAYKESLDSMIQQYIDKLELLKSSINKTERLKHGLDQFLDLLENTKI